MTRAIFFDVDGTLVSFRTHVISPAVLEALPSVSYEGVCGLIEFDEIGDVKRDQAYIKAANTETGAWDFVMVQGVE